MKFLAKLTPAFLALFMATSANLQAQERPRDMVYSVHGENEKYDLAPEQKKGEYKYSVEVIEYTADEMVLNFLYDEIFSSINIGFPTDENAWFIEDENGNKYKAKAVRNLRTPKKIIHSGDITETAYIRFEDDNHEFRCQVVFERLPNTVKKFDLIEGRRSAQSYFHVMGIAHNPKVQDVAETAYLPKQSIINDHVISEEIIKNSYNQPVDLIQPAEFCWCYQEPAKAIVEEPVVEILEPQEVLIEPSYYSERETNEKTAAYPLSKIELTQEKPMQVSHNVAYTVDKIDYREKETVLTFTFHDDVYPSGYFFGPAGEHAWILRDQDGNIYNMKALNNIRVNGVVVADGVAEKMDLALEVLQTYDKRNKFTCEIVFDRLPASVHTADLIEGLGKDGISWHFNVKQIDIQQPISRTEDTYVNNGHVQSPIVIEEEPQEEVVEFTQILVSDQPSNIDKPSCDENCKPGQAAASNYVLFPNPNKGAFNLTNNGVTQPNAQIQLFDLKGQQLYSQKTLLQEKETHSFKVEALPAGQYLLRISHEDKTSQTLPVIVVE